MSRRYIFTIFAMERLQTDTLIGFMNVNKFTKIILCCQLYVSPLQVRCKSVVSPM